MQVREIEVKDGVQLGAGNVRWGSNPTIRKTNRAEGPTSLLVAVDDVTNAATVRRVDRPEDSRVKGRYCFGANAIPA